MRLALPRLVLFSLALTMLLPVAQAQAHRDTRSPENMPTEAEIKNPPKTWIDKDTGHRVIRLTDEPSSASFYFNVNAYTPDGSEMIYTTPEGISVLDLKTFKTRSVVKGRVHTIVVGHKTPSVFYIKPEDNKLCKTNVDTGVTTMLAKVPPHGNIATVNADETLAAGTYDEVYEPSKEFGHNGAHPGPQTTQTSPLLQADQQGRDDGAAPRRAHPSRALHHRPHRQRKSHQTPALHGLDQPPALLPQRSDPAHVLPRRPMAKGRSHLDDSHRWHRTTASCTSAPCSWRSPAMNSGDRTETRSATTSRRRRVKTSGWLRLDLKTGEQTGTT